MDDALKARLAEQEAAVQSLLDDSKVDGLVYAKFMLYVAHDYAAGGSCPGALKLVLKFPDDYYGGPFKEQCKQDETFAAAMYRLARFLVSDGYVDLGPCYQFPGNFVGLA